MVAGTATMEEEVKLLIADGATAAQILVDPDIVARSDGSSWQSQPLAATYLDTPGRNLLAQGFGFRFRRQTKTNQWRVCLKGEGDLVDGLCVRREWEQTIDRPVDRLSALPDGPLRRQILNIASGDEILVPLLETVFLRQIIVIALEGDCLVELALDQGEIRAGGKAMPLLELELERKNGSLEPLLRFSGMLRQRYNLSPSRHSKFALGLTLLAEGVL